MNLDRLLHLFSFPQAEYFLRAELQHRHPTVDLKGTRRHRRRPPREGGSSTDNSHSVWQELSTAAPSRSCTCSWRDSVNSATQPSSTGSSSIVDSLAHSLAHHHDSRTPPTNQPEHPTLLLTALPSRSTWQPLPLALIQYLRTELSVLDFAHCSILLKVHCLPLQQPRLHCQRPLFLLPVFRRRIWARRLGCCRCMAGNKNVRPTLCV